VNNSKRWGAVIGFSIVGMVLLWWATNQQEAVRQITATTFQFPKGRTLAWILTLVAVGAAFSLAASAARTGQSRTRVAPTLVAAALPAAVVTYWFAWMSGLPWVTGRGFTFWVLRDSTPVIASSVIVGFLVGGLAAARARWYE
jgi:hypothetical protein